jgi:hypothetical protein
MRTTRTMVMLVVCAGMHGLPRPFAAIGYRLACCTVVLHAVILTLRCQRAGKTVPDAVGSQIRELGKSAHDAWPAQNGPLAPVLPFRASLVG